jgi:hypothetical protein
MDFEWRQFTSAAASDVVRKTQIGFRAVEIRAARQISDSGNEVGRLPSEVRKDEGRTTAWIPSSGLMTFAP